jgi:hypothetical protein
MHLRTSASTTPSPYQIPARRLVTSTGDTAKRSPTGGERAIAQGSALGKRRPKILPPLLPMRRRGAGERWVLRFIASPSADAGNQLLAWILTAFLGSTRAPRVPTGALAGRNRARENLAVVFHSQLLSWSAGRRPLHAGARALPFIAAWFAGRRGRPACRRRRPADGIRPLSIPSPNVKRRLYSPFYIVSGPTWAYHVSRHALETEIQRTWNGERPPPCVVTVRLLMMKS